MECKNVKPLLSEYLDRKLQNDLTRDVKEHLLSCKECSREFFMMKSIAAELAGLERVKAPDYLLNRINQAVASPSLFSKILDFIPGSGGFKLPMEFVTLAATVTLVFLIFYNVNTDKSKTNGITDAGGYKTTLNKESEGTVELNFTPAAITQPPDTDDVISVARGRSSDNFDKMISDFEKTVTRAGGDIVKKIYARDSGRIDAVMVKIPLNSYSSFIRRVEMRGRFNPPAPSLTDQSRDPVVLKISLNLSD